MRTHGIKVTVVDFQPAGKSASDKTSIQPVRYPPFGVWYIDDILIGPTVDWLSRIILHGLCNSVRQTTRWVPSTVKNIGERVSSFLTRCSGPQNLAKPSAHRDN